MAFDPLESFAGWFLQQPMYLLIKPPKDAMRLYGPVLSFVLYRQPPFQVELISVLPGSEGFNEHRHPNIDSIEVLMHGRIYFKVNGELVAPAEMIEAGTARTPTRVRETDWHGATVGPEGGAFLSIQHWLHGVEPTSVGLDWDGATVGMAHDALLGDGHG